MIVRSLFVAAFVAAILMALSAPAGAFYCPKQAKAIDAALATGNLNLSAAQIAEVKSLRDQGMVDHGGGSHAAGVTSLAKAVRIILGGM